MFLFYAFRKHISNKHRLKALIKIVNFYCIQRNLCISLSGKSKLVGENIQKIRDVKNFCKTANSFCQEKIQYSDKTRSNGEDHLIKNSEEVTKELKSAVHTLKIVSSCLRTLIILLLRLLLNETPSLQ